MKRKERPKRDFLPLIVFPVPLHLWPNLFFLAHSFFRPFRFSSLTSLCLFPLQKTTPLDPLYPLCPYIALLSWQFLFHCSFIVPFPKLPSHILLCPSRLSQSMTCLCPFSILFRMSSVLISTFALLLFPTHSPFVLSDTRTVSTSLCVLYFTLISLSEDWQTE